MRRSKFKRRYRSRSKACPDVRQRCLPVRKCLRDRHTHTDTKCALHRTHQPTIHPYERPYSHTNTHNRVEHVTNKLQRADSCTLPTPPPASRFPFDTRRAPQRPYRKRTVRKPRHLHKGKIGGKPRSKKKDFYGNYLVNGRDVSVGRSLVAGWTGRQVEKVPLWSFRRRGTFVQHYFSIKQISNYLILCC